MSGEFRAVLQYARLGESELSRINLGAADLSNADFQKADLAMSNFRGAHCVNTDFSGAFLQGSDFHGADARSANFSSANLEGCTLSGADCRGVNFTDSNLVGVVFDDTTRFDNGVDPLAMGMVMRVADVERMAADSVGVDFSHRRFAFQSTFGSACMLKACRFHKSVLEHSVWDSVCIDAVDFTQATLSWSRFGAGAFQRRQMVVNQAQFTGANLSNAHFNQVVFRQTSFNEAVMTGLRTKDVAFHECDLRGTNFTGIRGLSALTFAECIVDRNTVFFDTVSVSQLIESGTLHGLTLE